MGQVNYEQVNLLLRLYELRREPRLRQARAWFAANFFPKSGEEMMSKYPPGSEENTHVRMVSSYWDMVAGIVDRGLIDEDFFFENNGELWVVWDRQKAIIPAMREVLKDTHIFEHLERVGTRFEAWIERRAPGRIEATRQLLARLQAPAAKAAGE